MTALERFLAHAAAEGWEPVIDTEEHHDGTTYQRLLLEHPTHDISVDIMRRSGRRTVTFEQVIAGLHDLAADLNGEAS